MTETVDATPSVAVAIMPAPDLGRGAQRVVAAAVARCSSAALHAVEAYVRAHPPYGGPPSVLDAPWEHRTRMLRGEQFRPQRHSLQSWVWTEATILDVRGPAPVQITHGAMLDVVGLEAPT